MPETKRLYSLHPSFRMEEAYYRNLLERTGKTLDQWVSFVKENGPKSEQDRREWLMSEHGLTTNYAWWIAQEADGKATSSTHYDPDAMVEAMFGGRKAALRPLYDKLLKLGLCIGKDVKACPCQTMVPLFRRHVFAQIKPTTNTRIDMGFALKDTPVSGRLIDTGGFAKKDRITHRIPIYTLSEIDEEIKKWLRVAYEMDA